MEKDKTKPQFFPIHQILRDTCMVCYNQNEIHSRKQALRCKYIMEFTLINKKTSDNILLDKESNADSLTENKPKGKRKTKTNGNVLRGR